MEKDQLLRIFYLKLHDIISRGEKNLYKKSLLFTLARVSSNKASKYLNESSIRFSLLDKDVFKELAEKMLIRCGDSSHDEYILTADGIWEFEKTNYGLTERDLVEYIQSKNFSLAPASNGLNDRERVILFALIGIRNFSFESAMDLNDEATPEYWLDILNESYKFLLDNKFIKQDKTIFAKQGNEHPVSYLMVRLNDLPKATKHIFAYGKNRKYYIDILENGSISKDKLLFLFKLVLGKLSDMQKLNGVVEFCSYLANEKSKFVRGNFAFIDASTSLLLKDALQTFYVEGA
jgi:hypothetical protein